MNDKRHGWGTTYDRNGQKLYEGDWRCGKNDFEDERIMIEDNCEEDDLIIQNYPNLQSIIVKKESLQNLNSLKICNCDKLKTIEVEDSSGFDNWRYGVFSNVNNMIISSIC